jgi:hypothetical protein
MPDGFELLFTKPVNREVALANSSYEMSSHTYLYHSTYGSDEIQNQELTARRVTVSDDALTVRLYIDGLRELFVHELVASNIRSQTGEPLLHPHAWYTLNRIPKE